MAEPTAVEDAGVAFVSPLPQEVTLRHFELWQQSVAEERPVVELEAQAVDPGVGESDTPASYSLTIIGRERKRLLADLTEFLSDEGLETVSARIFTLPNESIMDMFQLRDPTRVLSDDTCTSRVYNTLVRLAGGGGDAGPAAADSPAGQATRGMGGKSRSNTKHVGSSSGASSAGAGPGMASLASATSAAGAASDSVHASDSLDEIARRANSNTGHEVSRIRRCASNIAVIDLAATLERQDSEQASHHHRAPVYTPDMLKMLPASPSNQALSSRAAGSRSGYPPGYPPIDFDVLVAGEWLYYYSSKSGNRYRYKFRLSSDHQFLLWEGRSLRLATCIGVVFGPKSSTFLKLDEKNDRVDQDWLCFSVVSFPREGKNDGNPTTVDVACETDDQLATWLFGLQRLCGAAPEVRGGNDPYSYEAILRQRFMYKLSTRAHDRGLTVRQYFLKKVRKYGARVGRESQLGQRDEEVAALERDIEVLRKQVRQANAREAVLATKLHTLQADWDIDFSEVSLSHTIGRGAYSEMWRGVWRGCAVAVKVLKGPDSASPTGAAASAAVGADHTGEALDAEGSHEHRHLHDFHDEVVVLSKLRHPNIVLFMAACAHPPNLCIVTEFCHGGNLFNALRRPSWRAEIGHSQMLSMTRDAARGMHYLHKGNMIHRDLKSQNILLDRPVEHGCPVLKIADFGLSRDFQNGSTRQSRGLEDSVAAVMTSETGTYRYMSPNVIRHEPYNAKADVYSFAVTLYVDPSYVFAPAVFWPV